MEKLQAYQGWTGQLHEWRDSVRERYQHWREENPGNPIEIIKNYIDGPRSDADEDFSHVYRFSFIVILYGQIAIERIANRIKFVSHCVLRRCVCCLCVCAFV